MTSRFELLGDEPPAVEEQARQWRGLAQRMGEVAREVAGQATVVASAWPDGGAAPLAIDEARQCSDCAAEAAIAYAGAARLLRGLVEPLTRWRRQVSELDAAWEVLSHAQEQAQVAARADLGDPHSLARIVLTQQRLTSAQARTGHPDTASVEAAYAALRRQAKGQIDEVALRLGRLAAQGAAAVPGTGVGLGAVSRFRTELAGLAEGARAQGRLAPQMSRLVDAGVLPPEAVGWDAVSFAGYLQEHPLVAAQLVARRPVAASAAGPGVVLSGWPALVSPPVVTSPLAPVPLETFLATLGAPPSPTLTSVGDPGWPDRLAVRAAFEALTPAEQQLAALLWPASVGNLSGAPFAVRATANHVRVVAAVGDQERRNEAGGQLEGDRAHLAELRTLAADPSRQVLWFDNAGDGAVVELHGSLTSATVGVGVFVPGTSADLGGHETNAARSRSWVDASAGQVAMVTWMGGDLPDDIVWDAPFRDYADRLAPRLATFSHDLRQEIDGSPAAHNEVQGLDGPRTGPAITMIGHSYGGAVVGTSEQYGLDADNVIHVESAGAGHDVGQIDDLRPGRCDLRRFTITAGHDPIRLSQGLQVPTEGWQGQLVPDDVKQASKDLGHGADPRDLYRVERLTGDRGADGRVLGLREAHGGVLDEGADGWRNIHRVLTGLPPEVQR